MNKQTNVWKIQIKMALKLFQLYLIRVFTNYREIKMKLLQIVCLLFLSGCSSNYEWGWYILSPENIEGLTNLKFLISGITTTIYISVVSIILAMIIGLIVALPSLSNNKFLTYK